MSLDFEKWFDKNTPYKDRKFFKKDWLEAAFNAGVNYEKSRNLADAEWCIQNYLEHLIPERISNRK
jgi:hypothetical protein